MITAKALAQDLHTQLAGLVRAILQALEDGRISPWEGMQLGMRGMQLGSSILVLLQQAPPELRRDLLALLEHGRLTLPP